MIALAAPAAILIEQSLLDPPEDRAIASAAEWAQAALTGSIATSIAVIAIASIGFGMLMGRLELRRGFAVLLGCFILFGAPYIARGLMNSAQSDAGPIVQSALPPPVFAKPQPNGPPPANAYDPYAGAAVPR